MKKKLTLQHPHPTIVFRQIESHHWTFGFPRVTPEADRLLDEGIDCMNDGDLKRAIAFFRYLVSELPEHIDAFHHLAIAQDRLQQDMAALETWQKAFYLGRNAFPDHFTPKRDRIEWQFESNRPFLRACHGLGFKHLQLCQVEAALAVFEDLLRFNPRDNQGIRGLIVDCYFRLNRPADVLKLCNRFRGDGMEQILYGRALAFVQLGRLPDAEKALRRALAFLPLVGHELIKKKHRRPKAFREGYIHYGGSTQAYSYWQEQGIHWKNTPGALELLRKCAEAASQRAPESD